MTAPLPTRAAVLHDLLVHWAVTTPDAVALTDLEGPGTPRRDLTWADLRHEVDAWAEVLLGLGLRHGDRLALRARPGSLALTVYLAATSVGAVFQGLNPASTERELAHVLSDAAPTVVLDALDGRAAEVAGRHATPVVRRVAECQQALRSARAGVTPEALAPARERVRPRDAALLVHTSGSTGRPKGALLPHDALVLAGRVHGGLWGGPGLTTLCPFPVNHVASLSDIFGTALYAGGRTVLMPAFDAAATLAALQAERVTFWGVIPAVGTLVVAEPGWAAADLSHIERVVWGGGAAPVPLLQALRDKGLRVQGCYGSTETVGNVCFTDPDEPDLELLAGGIGRTDPAYVTALDPATGELLVRSPAPFLGYLGRPDDTAAVFTADGFLRTGDVARQLPDGGYALVGRTREMYKSGGYNVYPREVELALEAVEGVRQAAVVPVPDPLYGEVGHAFVVGDGLEEAQVLGAARGTLAGYKLPKRLTVVPDLPLLPVGKVDKGALRDRLQGALP